MGSPLPPGSWWWVGGAWDRGPMCERCMGVSLVRPPMHSMAVDASHCRFMQNVVDFKLKTPKA